MPGFSADATRKATLAPPTSPVQSYNSQVQFTLYALRIMTGSDTSQQNPRKRRRPALSCEQCRRRKIRCDREMPCGPCTKGHPPMSCEYVNEGKAALDAKLESSRIPDNASPPHDSAARLFNGAQSSNDGARIAELERTVQALQGRVKDLEHDLQVEGSHGRRLLPHDGTAASRIGGGVDDRVADGETRNASGQLGRLDRPQTLIPSLAPRLKSSGERVKLFGTTHWALVFQQFRLLRQVRSTALYPEGGLNDIGKLLKEVRNVRRVIKKQQQPRLEDPAPGLLNDLPPREICDELVQHYMRTLGLIYRILHNPSFYQDYERFWENPPAVSPRFLMKLLLILAIGSVFYCKPGPTNELGLPVRRWIYATQWLLSGPFEKDAGNLEGLQLHCLLLLCRQAYAVDKESSWISAGNMLRQAVSQGLHRDPTHFPTLSAFDCEMRRRIWAAVLELNVQLSIDAAMPPLFCAEDFDTRPPSNLDDEDFDPASTSLPDSQPKTFYTASSLQILLSQSFPIRLKIARTINECTHEQSYEAALQLGSQLSTACKEMAVTFLHYFARTSGSRLRPTQFHHRLMDTLLRRFLLNLYRPFTIEAINDPRFYLARKLSLDSALIMASYGDSFGMPEASDQNPLQDLQRLALSGAGLFKCHLSLDVMIVISFELITQIEEDVAAQPAGFSLLSPDLTGQIAHTARESMIRALERIMEQLYESVAAGIPSMKRYCLIAGVLAQIRAVPRSEAELTQVCAAFMDAARTCRALLQEYLAESKTSAEEGVMATPAGTSTGWTPGSGIGSSIDSEFAFPSLGFDDLSFWDIPAFIDTSAFDAGQMRM
ncbi:uncharacterized protein N7459_005734 [Penicillium hispanicum]|uniref:uncharacterized protein n=1 Tax=Penicillium hispanicum TaxID=1080232 RepID=UPI0025414DF6|nr:uncharacterized protein N7459_005734 [Penicillium hispanicum]KAJ5579749.1 hypothetical protein N7459_005734 [Penicillium hispanicum]